MDGQKKSAVKERLFELEVYGARGQESWFHWACFACSILQRSNSAVSFN